MQLGRMSDMDMHTIDTTETSSVVMHSTWCNNGIMIISIINWVIDLGEVASNLQRPIFVYFAQLTIAIRSITLSHVCHQVYGT